MVAAGVLAILGSHLISKSKQRARLLMSAPSELLQDRSLYRYALALGKPAYAERCAGCHGADMRGDSSKGVPNLTDKDWIFGEGRITDIERIVTYGIRAGYSKGQNLASMPAFAKANPYYQYKMTPLQPQEVRDVVAYLLAMEGRPVDRDAAERGGKVYRNGERGLCFDCHAPDGKGDTAIGAPNLTDNIWLYGDGSEQSIYASIARGQSGRCPAWIGTLSPEAIRGVAVYVHAASAKATTAQANVKNSHEHS